MPSTILQVVIAVLILKLVLSFVGIGKNADKINSAWDNIRGNMKD